MYPDGKATTIRPPDVEAMPNIEMAMWAAHTARQVGDKVRHSRIDKIDTKAGSSGQATPQASAMSVSCRPALPDSLMPDCYLS